MSRLSTSPLFVSVLLGLAGFTAYRCGWIPVELGGAATGSVLEEDHSQTGLEAVPEIEADGSAPIEIGRTSFKSIEDQSEPALLEDSLAFNDRRTTTRRRDVELEEPESISTSRIRLVAEEQPAAEPEIKREPISEPPVRIAQRAKDQEPAFDFTEIDRQIQAGQVVEAHKALSKLYWQQPELRSSVQERIGLTAKAIYFSPQPHVQEPYVVQAGDQLRKIATKHHVPWQFLSRLNRIDPKRLREGQKLKVIDGPFGAVVTLRDFELTLHHGGQYVRSYPCCIGKNNSTPVGKLKVLNKVTSPQYTDPDGKVFASGDRKNPLGTHWIDLGDSYGIHGTIEPDSIGKAESRGCIRLLNTDIAEVYDMLDLASEVVIRP